MQCLAPGLCQRADCPTRADRTARTERDGLGVSAQPRDVFAYLPPRCVAPIHLEGLLGQHAHYLEPRVRPRPSDRAAGSGDRRVWTLSAEDETTIMQDADEEARRWRQAVNDISAEDETTHMQDADEAAHCWRLAAREPPTEGRQTNVLNAQGTGDADLMIVDRLDRDRSDVKASDGDGCRGAWALSTEDETTLTQLADEDDHLMRKRKRTTGAKAARAAGSRRGKRAKIGGLAPAAA